MSGDARWAHRDVLRLGAAGLGVIQRRRPIAGGIALAVARPGRASGPDPMVVINGTAVRTLALRALDAAKTAGASYADVRLPRTLVRAVGTGGLFSFQEGERLGVGVRVRVDDAFGLYRSLRSLRGSVLGLVFLGAFSVEGRCLVQNQADPSGVPLRAHELATGTRTLKAGEQQLDSVSGPIHVPDRQPMTVYVPQQCVGARRCPLVVATFHQGDMIGQWHRTQADAHGMLFLAFPTPGLTDKKRVIAAVDSAVERVLTSFAVDPDKIALVTPDVNDWLARGNIGDVFSRVAALWWPDYPLELKGPQNTTTQFRLITGVNETNSYIQVYETVFKNVQLLRRAGYTAPYIGTLRGHANCREDYEDMWQWFAESWHWTTPKSVKRATVDLTTLLTAEKFARMTKFWDSFRERWDSIAGNSPIPIRTYRKELTVPLGGERQSIMIVDMPALATRDSSIAARLEALKMTAQQEEAYRIAFIAAVSTGALEAKGLIKVESVSTLRKNIDFINAHPDEAKALQLKMVECHR